MDGSKEGRKERVKTEGDFVVAMEGRSSFLKSVRLGNEV